MTKNVQFVKPVFIIFCENKLNIEYFACDKLKDTLNIYTRWRHGSVVRVRTSVFGWRTFPDYPIYGVTTSSVKCPLWVNQPSQLSLPSLRGR